jgi:uncharacterized membrane protein
MKRGSVVKLREWIARLLWTGGTSLGIAVLAGLLSVVLAALGDGTGADAVRGVALVAVSVFVLAFVALVVFLAVNELDRDKPPPGDGG